jgi:hypothetical protein
MKIHDNVAHIRRIQFNGKEKHSLTRLLIAISTLLTINLLLISCNGATYVCTDPLGCLKISPGSPIVIGAILATSGEQRSVGTASLLYLEKAVADINILFGHPIQLLRYGTECSAGSAQVAATEFATYTDLTAVIGPTCIDEMKIAGQILLSAGIPMLGPVPDSAAAYAITNRLLAAIEKVGVQMPDRTVYIPRQALLKVLNLFP